MGIDKELDKKMENLLNRLKENNRTIGFSKTTYKVDPRDKQIEELLNTNKRLEAEKQIKSNYIEKLEKFIIEQNKLLEKYQAKDKRQKQIQSVSIGFTQKISSIYQSFIKWLNT